ncbi:hypothetical protein AU476_40815 [Cupriavidus sp. UYMSc13B]|nr:hypothetical protein AU476_40815 [Cupriavidus sp. UYMSc13B]
MENSISPIQGLRETTGAINAALASDQEVDVAARRDILETYHGLLAVPKDVLSKVEAAALALQNAAAFRTIDAHSEKVEAAYAIENNMEQQANYRAALIEQAPDVAKGLGQVLAQEQRMVAEKDARKSLEAQSLLQDHLKVYEHAIGKRITVPHGDFHFLEGGDALGDDARYGVVPKASDKPVIRFKNEDDLGKYLAEQNIDEADRRAIDAFYALSRQQDRARHLEVQIAPENSIIAIERSVPKEAINLDEYISRLETGKDNGLDLDAGAEGGPSTLLRGRFIRDEAGQYRRIGEERVALVDEGDKIRFVDKQFDTFQAATELASEKQWQAIQVTGTDKFRAEAWFAARLAGLEVVGYEPKEKDLARLEQAVRNGLAQSHAEPSPEVASSRTKAEDFALSAGKGLQGISADGSYKGKIVHETDHHVVQDVGRNVAVVHEKAGLEAERLQQARAGDKSIRVQYSKGRASIAAEHERSREAALSR